jgi:hypothetical protein
LLEKIIGTQVFRRLCEHDAWAPDFFVYKEDHSDWFFCEVKGPRDELRPSQRSQFRWALSNHKEKSLCFDASAGSIVLIAICVRFCLELIAAYAEPQQRLALLRRVAWLSIFR